MPPSDPNQTPPPPPPQPGQVVTPAGQTAPMSPPQAAAPPAPNVPAPAPAPQAPTPPSVPQPAPAAQNPLAAQVAPAIPINPPQPGRHHWWVWSIIGAVGLFIVAAVIFVTFALQVTAAPTKTASDFFTDLFNNKVTDAYALTSQQFHQTYNADQFTQVAKPLTGLQGAKIGFNNRMVTGGQATVSGDLEYQGSNPVTVKLQKENGHWLIYNFKVGN